MRTAQQIVEDFEKQRAKGLGIIEQDLQIQVYILELLIDIRGLLQQIVETSEKQGKAMTVNTADLSEFQRYSLDFRISIAEQQRHPTFLCVNGEYLTLAQAKQLREEWDMAQTKDYVIQTRGNRQLILNKQADGTYQAKLFLNRENTKRTLATLVIEEAEMKKLANYSAGLLKK